MEAEQKFTTILLDDIANNRLILPTLPEIAAKIRKMVDSPDYAADKLGRIISTDAALSARLLQVANSVFFRGLNPVENVQTAIIRLGSVCVRNVVSSLVMAQLYQAKETAIIKKDLHKLWVHGARVAAISQVLARRYTKLDPEEAMLGGLIHDIGILPILRRAVDFPELLEDRAALQRVINNMHTDVGRLILEDWGFPEKMLIVAAEHENLQRNTSEKVDLADIVLVANIHAHLGVPGNKFAQVDIADIPALKKLGLTPKESITTIIEAQSEIAEIQKLLTSP